VKVSLSDEAIEDARAAADWYFDQGVKGELVRVIAVSAHRRRPGYWLGRR
jgi:hypothetical protein